ncbi:MAG: hypothetical protein ACYCOX_18535 [Acidobacteriaceae bacterium]
MATSASSDIINPTPGWDPVLGDSMNPSYGFTKRRASTLLNKKAVGGTPWTRETQNTGHTFSLSWIGRTYACMKRLQWYYEQYEDGFFTIVDWDGGGRQYVGRFTSAPQISETANNKWDAQNVTFEEMPEVAMQVYPSVCTNDSVVFYISNDFGDQKLATSGAWTETAYTVASGFAPSGRMALALGTNYTVFLDPGTLADWAQCEYRGYGFQLWLMQGPEWGQCNVFVDGVLAQMVDCYAAAEMGPMMVLAQNLPLDLHRVQVTCNAAKNASATGTQIGWYALQVMR